VKRKILDFFRLIWMIPLFERVLVLFTKDKIFGSLVTKFPPNHYQYSINSLRTVVRNGIKYKLDLADAIDWYIYFGFKETSRQTLYSLIKQGDTIIDVGANVGEITLHAAKIVDQTGHVHAFEPDPKNYIRLTTNLNLNKFSNISHHKLGLGDEAGTFVIGNVDERNRGMNRIIHSSITSDNASKIEVTTLDNYVKEKNVTHLNLVKIDVEGFEYNVLKGGVKTLDTFRPIFFIELDDSNLREQKSSASKLIAFLEDKNYSIFHSETNERITSTSNFNICHYDIIAKPKGL
jgi:FkbM family methyltransferase